MIISAFYLKSLLSSLITKIITSLQTSQILTKHKTSREEQNKLEQIRAKNRESARRSRAKKTQDLILLLEQNNILKKENNNLKSKLNLLCPTCKLLFSNDIQITSYNIEYFNHYNQY